VEVFDSLIVKNCRLQNQIRVWFPNLSLRMYNIRNFWWENIPVW